MSSARRAKPSGKADSQHCEGLIHSSSPAATDRCGDRDPAGAGAGVHACGRTGPRGGCVLGDVASNGCRGWLSVHDMVASSVGTESAVRAAVRFHVAGVRWVVERLVLEESAPERNGGDRRVGVAVAESAALTELLAV